MARELRPRCKLDAAAAALRAVRSARCATSREPVRGNRSNLEKARRRDRYSSSLVPHGCDGRRTIRKSEGTAPRSDANVRMREGMRLRRVFYVNPTTFLYAHRRPSQRRHTCPQTSLPEIDRRGTTTRQRCQTSAHAGFELSLTRLLCALISAPLSPPRKHLVTVSGSQPLEITHLFAQALHLKKSLGKIAPCDRAFRCRRL